MATVPIDSTLNKKTVSFKLYPSSIITNDFTNCVVLGVVSVDAVTQINPAEMHVIVYPTLPSGAVNDYAGYDYVLVKLASGLVTAVGVPWIIPDTVTVVDGIKIVVTINNQNLDFAGTVRKILVSNEIVDFQISVTS